jgi:hypothetical protein
MAQDGFWIIRGTETHGGIAGHLEEAAARLLEATKYPTDSEMFSCWFLKLRLQNRLFDITHHGRLGRLPWTRINALGTIVYEMVDEYIRNREPLPDVVIRGHYHRWGDTGSNYPIRAVSLPCWQLATAYAHRVAPRRRADIGAVIFVVEDGQIGARAVLYRIKPEVAWDPDREERQGAKKWQGQSRMNGSSSPSESSSKPSWLHRVQEWLVGRRGP